MEIVSEFWSFLRERRKTWLAPLVIVLLLMAGLFAVANGAGIMSPILYVL